jgi:hypothetical protein
LAERHVPLRARAQPQRQRAGGSDRVQYFVSGSQFNQEGVVLGSGYDRQAGRVNVDVNASNRLRFRTSLSLSRESHQRVENDDTIDGVVTNAIAGTPNIAVRKADGTFTSPADGLAYSNPLAIATHDRAESRSFRAFGNLEAAYQASSVVTLNGRVGMDVINLRDLRWLSPLVDGTYWRTLTANRSSAITPPTATSSRALSTRGRRSVRSGRSADRRRVRRVERQRARLSRRHRLRG